MLTFNWKHRAPCDFRAMRFLNKYDLQEPLTAGPIKVYEALEPDSGLRRLIQILEWQEVPADVSTLQILEHFRQAAPDPPGIILDAGRIEQTTEIYLVTSFPADPLAVQRWVNSYLAKSGQSATNPPSKPAAPGQNAIHPVAPATPAADTTQPWTKHEPGAFTKEFLAALDGSYKIAAMPPSSTPKPEPAKEPGDFTREFLALAIKEQKPAKEPAPTSQTDTPAWFKDVDAGPPTAPMPVPSVPIPGKKTGEFTRFFRGYSEPPSESSGFTPAPDAFAPPKRDSGQNAPGEFTQMFNPNLAPPPQVREEPINEPLDLGPRSAPPPVRFDSDPIPARPPAASRRPVQSPFDSPPQDAASFEPAWTGQARGPTSTPPALGTQAPRTPVEAPPAAPSFAPAWKEDKPGATQLITPPGAQQPPPEPAPRGPSEFTRIISASAVPGANPPPPPPPNPAPAMPPPIQVQIPSVQLPSMATPAAPQVPHLPQVQVPQVQLPVAHMPPPPAPAPPQPALPPAAKPVSYLPLIITLNVLLIVAVAIVLYFALKHH